MPPKAVVLAHTPQVRPFGLQCRIGSAIIRLVKRFAKPILTWKAGVEIKLAPDIFPCNDNQMKMNPAVLVAFGHDHAAGIAF